MTPLERLLAEGVPDGTFGGARQPGWSAPLPPARRPRSAKAEAPRPAREPIPEWQARLNYRELLAALAEKPRPVRHLHAVPPPPSVAA